MLLTLFSGRAGTDAIVKWRTRSGIRRTSASDTLSVDLEAFTNVATEGGIDRVEFSISENGGAATVVTVSAPSLRTPNYSAQNSYLPGVTSGMAPFWGWGTTLDCNTLAAGTVVVTAVVYSVAGWATTVPGSITLYNDKDAVDRRPSTKTIYCSPSGSDSNDGLSRGAPKLSIVRAIEAARANPAGSSSADFDCGGAEVVLVAGAHEWAGGSYSVGDWHTSGAWWLTITLESGATLTPASAYPARYLTARGYSGGGTCRIRFVGGTWTGGGGGVIYVPTGVACEAWADGLIGQSAYWSSGQHYSVRFAEDNAEFFALDGPGTLTRYASCVRKRGCVTAFHGWTDVTDCVVENWIGVALQEVGSEVGGALNLLATGNRYTTGVAGWADVTGGADLSVSIPSAGQMRIDATAAMSMDFAAGFSELAGTSYWGCKCGNFTSGGNNGTFPVLSTGTNGSGFPYVVVTNASAVVEVGTASAYLVTAKISDQTRYIDAIHGDVLQYNTDRTGTIYSHVRVEDAQNVQVVASNGHNLTRCAFHEWGDAAATGQVWNFASTSLADCLFVHCTTANQANFSASGETFTGTEATECVFASVSNWPAGIATTDCHVVTGSAIGTGGTTGTWFDNDTTVDPWDLSPTVGNLDSATGVVPYPSDWWWSGATGPTRGCSRMVGLGAWNIGTAYSISVDVVAFGATVPDVSLSVAVTLPVDVASYSLGLVDVVTATGLSLSVDAASFAMAAQDAGLAAAVSLAVDVATIDVAWISVDLATAEGPPTIPLARRRTWAQERARRMSWPRIPTRRRTRGFS